MSCKQIMTATALGLALLRPGNVHAQPSPTMLDFSLSDGEVRVEQVAWTFEPVCIRPWEVDVIASDPEVMIENLTGILSNGCGGSTSTFDIRFTGDGTSRDFDLLFVDLFSSEPQVIDAIPTSITVPEPSGVMLLALGLLLSTRRSVSPLSRA